jgi:hypothetical protein
MNVQLFYHVATMGNWRQVVQEQTALFASVGLRPMIGRVGPPPSRDMWLGRFGDVVYRSRNLLEYETPTLQKLWEWSRAHPADAVLYCHTKGVSQWRRPAWTAWRQLMNKWVVARWRENLPLLEDHDILGVDYMRRDAAPDFTSHFAGNFWLATCGWINRLVSPEEHRRSVKPYRIRYSPEMWPLSADGYRYVSLCCENVRMGRRGNAINLLARPLP